ncbi:50S ribosomal subunit protein L25 [Candidatus Vidania fulgoroideae]|nr:50S ribosomal subunit protein L25 [Candidatus Vidania fulgoroideae]
MFNLRFFFRIKNRKDFIPVNLEVKRNTFISLFLKKEDSKFIFPNIFEEKIIFGKKKIRVFLKDFSRNPKTDLLENLSLFLYIKNKAFSLPIKYYNFKDSPLVRNKKLSIYVNIRKLDVFLKKEPKKFIINIDLKKVKKRIRVKDIDLPKEYELYKDSDRNKYLVSLKRKR